MAFGHQRAAWAHTVAVAAGFIKAMGGKGPGAFELMPDCFKAKADDKRTAEEEEAESALGFMGLEAGLATMAKQWRE